MRSGNPVLKSDTFDAVARRRAHDHQRDDQQDGHDCWRWCMITAIYTWGRFYATKDPATIMPLVWIGAIGGFVARAHHRIQDWSGSPSRRLSTHCSRVSWSAACRRSSKWSIPGIVVQAVGLTFGTMAACWWRTGPASSRPPRTSSSA